MTRTLADLILAPTLTPAEAARLHGRSRQFWIGLATHREIAGKKRGQWLLNHESIKEWLVPEKPKTFAECLRVAKAGVGAG